MPDSSNTIMILLQSAWTQVLAVVGVIVWLIRGEAATRSNRAEIDRLWAAREEDLRAAKEARDATNGMLREVRQDIKTLLARK